MRFCEKTISFSVLFLLIFSLTILNWPGIGVFESLSLISPASADLVSFTIIALPDTQFYSESYPGVFDNQTQWIANAAESLNTVFVTHEGDIVNNGGLIQQWQQANHSLSMLDGHVPWATVPGNHDGTNVGGTGENLNNYNTYFPRNRFNGQLWYGGAYNNVNSNSFELFSGGADDYLIFHFQYHPSIAVLAWANATIANYPTRRVMITTHDYMNTDGSRSTEGNHIWNSFVAAHADQVFLVLCGHNHAEARRTDTINGHAVYQLLADYQEGYPNGGNGWLRILDFHPAEDKIYVKTFSPYVNQYQTDAASQFSLDYDMTSENPTSVTYDESANAITVTGYSSERPCTFKDVYDADVAGSWGVVGLVGSDQFSFSAHISIGDGSTTTYFTDTNKQILVMAGACSSTYRDFITIERYATLTFGQLDDASTYRTKSGIQVIIENQDTWGHVIENRWGSTYIYSSAFSKSGGYDGFAIYNYAGTLRIWNTQLNGLVSLSQVTDIAYVTIFGDSHLYNGLTSPFSASTVLGTTVYNVDSSGNAVRIWFNGSTYKDMRFVNVASVANNEMASGDSYFLNCEAVTWAFNWQVGTTSRIYRQYEFDLTVTDHGGHPLEGSTVTLNDKDGNEVFSGETDENGQIDTQNVTRGYYARATGNTLQDASPHTLTITKEGYSSYTTVFTLTKKTDWTIALQPMSNGGLIEKVGFVPVDPYLTSPSGTYRWLDIADQAYGTSYRSSYNYSQASVELAYCTEGNGLQGLLKATNLKPNFAYQLKLVGTPGTVDNERIGLAGRWWQEEWTGTTWANGQNLNNKGDGSSPNPNDLTYFSRRDIKDASSPTDNHYRYTGYLVFNYFITDGNGSTALQFETGNCNHVIWKTTQQSKTANDGPLKTSSFDPTPSQAAYDTDYPSNTISIFGEWERLPMGQVNLQPGEYSCQIVLTEESFHGSGGTLAGNWAGAVTANIMFTIN